ncbi:hypothetical protein D3C84_973430 [compost metagenome]
MAYRCSISRSASARVYGSTSGFCTFTLGIAAAGFLPISSSWIAALRMPLSVFTAKRRSDIDGHVVLCTILRSLSDVTSVMGVRLR